jgi:hypothetical protein
VNPNDKSEMTDEFRLDEDLMEDMEEFETTAVLKDHGAYPSTSDTLEMKGLSPSDDFLEDIDSPTLTGVFEKN